jgi:hypothetical protein
MTQALHLINGQDIAARLTDANGRLAQLVKTPGMTDDQLVEELYLMVLCRLPTPTEAERMRKQFTPGGDRFAAAQDVLWALLNARAFLFNH